MRFTILLLIFFVSIVSAQSQPVPVVVDEVIAVVGDNPITRYELEAEYLQMKESLGGMSHDSALVFLLNKSLAEKLMLFKAEEDSIVVSDERVEDELNKRLRYYIQKFGSEQNMVEYLGKNIAQLKSEYRERIREQLKIQDIQGNILRDVKISPTEVQKYFNTIPLDSLPYYNAEVEVATFVSIPKVTAEEKQYAFEKILEIRNKIVLEGRDFATLASIYSDDPGSALKGGELGDFGRGEMVPQFEAAAFRLKPDSISPIIETRYGYHILKLISRSGERTNVRHILIKPNTVSADAELTRNFLDSIRNLAVTKQARFEDLVKKYSDNDESSKGIGGYLTDPITGATRISMDLLDKDLYFIIEGKNPGDITDPSRVITPDNQVGFRIVFIKNIWPPHKANLKDDYQKIQQAALENKRQKAMEDWIEKYRSKAFIRVNGEYAKSEVIGKWIKQ